LLQTSREARKTYVWGPEEMNNIHEPHNVGKEPIQILDSVESVARTAKQYQEKIEQFKEQGMLIE